MQIELKVTKNIREMYLKSLDKLTSDLEEIKGRMKTYTLTDQEVEEYTSLKKQRELKIIHNNLKMSYLQTREFIEDSEKHLSKYDSDRYGLILMFGVFLRQYLQEGADSEVKSPASGFIQVETWDEAIRMRQGLGGRLEHHIIPLNIARLGLIHIVVENLEEITEEDYLSGAYGKRSELYEKSVEIQESIYLKKRKDMLFNVGNVIKLDEVEYENLVSEIGVKQ